MSDIHLVGVSDGREVRSIDDRKYHPIGFHQSMLVGEILTINWTMKHQLLPIKAYVIEPTIPVNIESKRANDHN